MAGGPVARTDLDQRRHLRLVAERPDRARDLAGEEAAALAWRRAGSATGTAAISFFV